MVWEIAKRRRRSRLVGTAHFFPYHFRGALARLIGAARTVLFEGPLDEQSMRRVVDAGSGTVHVSLYHALNAGTRLRVCRDLGLPVQPLDAQLLYRELFFGRPDEWLEAELRGWARTCVTSRRSRSRSRRSTRFRSSASWTSSRAWTGPRTTKTTCAATSRAISTG